MPINPTYRVVDPSLHGWLKYIFGYMNPCIIFIMGVSGSGKTTIGLALSVKTGIPFYDADDFHPAANKKKMKAGKPLDDHDRQGWLESLNELAKKQGPKGGAIIACSALKEKYRHVLSDGIAIPIHWVYLEGDFNLVRERMEARTDHFMPPELLHSQYEALEKPGNAIVADITKPPAEIVAELLRRLGYQ